MAYSVGAGPWGVVAADLDNDGWPDVAVANSTGGSVTVLRNLGGGVLGNGMSFTVGRSPGLPLS